MTKSNGPSIYNVTPAFNHAQALGIAIAFFIVQLLLARHHEMWLDELQAWSLARDSANIPALFENLRYEGHPALWHLLIMPLTRLSDTPEAMQIFHILIASGSIYLLARYSPFNRMTILLITLSYYLFYEYAQIARNYAIGVFFAFAFCALFPVRHKHPITLSITLFFLAQTSVFGTILAICLGLALLVEGLLSAQAKSRPVTISSADYVGMAIILAGVLLAIPQLMPPADSSFANQWYLHLDLTRFEVVRGAMIGGYLPIPPQNLNYWNSLTLFSISVPGYSAASFVMLFVIVLMLSFLLISRPSALMLYTTITIACVAFFYAKYHGALRHHGFLFIGLVISFWIAPHCTEWKTQFPARMTILATRLQSAGYAVLTLILTVQATVGIIAASLDYRYTFSQLQDVALWIKQRMGPDDVVIGSVEFPTSGVAGFLNKPMYFLDSSRNGTFIRWDRRLEGWYTRLNETYRTFVPPALLRQAGGSGTIFVVANGTVDFSHVNLPLRSTFRPERSVQDYENLTVYEFAR